MRRPTSGPRRAWLSAAVLLFVVACTSAPGGEDVPTGTGQSGNQAEATSAPEGRPPPSGDQSWQQAYGPPDPVDVSVDLSDVTLTSRVSVANGGFLSLVGTDGTFFQFEVPPNAVLSDLDITMTLVSSIADSPLGDELVGAVAFEPEGLTFMQPATLTIMPATPIAVAEEGPFSAAGDGSDFHLYPLDHDPSAVRMHVHHFSLFGLFKTNAERRAEMIRKTARDVEDQLNQELQQVVAEARQRSVLGVADDDAEVLKLDHLDQYYRDRVLRPMLALAENDHTLYYEATQKYLAWERQRQLLGVADADAEDSWDTELRTSWQRAAENYFRYTVERCYEHDLGAIIDLIAWERSAQLLGIASAPGEAWEAAEKCATFTLEMDSSTESQLDTCVIGAGEIDESARVTAEVEIGAWDDAPWTGPMSWVEATHSAECEVLSSDVADCTSSFAGYGEAGQFAVLGIDWELNLYGRRDRDRPEEETQARVNVFRMVVQPQAPQIIYDSSCEGGWALFGGEQSGTDADDGPWYRTWQSLTRYMPCRGHVSVAQDDEDDEDDDRAGKAYYLDCWQYVGRDEELARWEYEASDNNLGRATEQTTFVLKHSPRE